jgi:hypothetical protein
MNRQRPENDPRLPRHLSDAVALYAILLVVAIVALMPLRAPEEAAEAVKVAAKPAAATQHASDDAER